MLGNPEMNLPGTFSYHDKGMQTVGVALTGATQIRSMDSHLEGGPVKCTFLFPFPHLPPQKLSSCVRSTRSLPHRTFLYLEPSLAPEPVRLDPKVSCGKVKALRRGGAEGAYDKLSIPCRELIKSNSVTLWSICWAVKYRTLSSCGVLVLGWSLRQRSI